MLVEGSELNIEIHKKHSQQQKIFTDSEEGSMPKANCYESPKEERVSHAFIHLISNIKSYNGVKI